MGVLRLHLVELLDELPVLQGAGAVGVHDQEEAVQVLLLHVHQRHAFLELACSFVVVFLLYLLCYYCILD